MLLALDVGNTNTVLGLYRIDGEKPELAGHWRVATHRTQTVDEYGVLFVNLFKMNGLAPNQVTNIIIASVVPPVDSTLRRVCEKYFHVDPMFVEPGIKTGMKMLIDNPTELGADRIADCIAAYDRYGGPCIVVDFGTATTFDAVSSDGEYLGGAIAPGIGIASLALCEHTAKLPKVDLRWPPSAIGRNTMHSLQSGLMFGYVGLVEGIVARFQKELGPGTRVIATGGLAEVIAKETKVISILAPWLTLDGLRIIHDMNC